MPALVAAGAGGGEAVPSAMPVVPGAALLSVSSVSSAPVPAVPPPGAVGGTVPAATVGDTRTSGAEPAADQSSGGALDRAEADHEEPQAEQRSEGQRPTMGPHGGTASRTPRRQGWQAVGQAKGSANGSAGVSAGAAAASSGTKAA